MKALLLVGGDSSRMGKDKYLLKRNGQSSYEFLASMLEKMGIEFYLAISKKQESAFQQFPYIIDQIAGIGPIGGIQSAISKHTTTSWLVIACDLLNLTKDTVEHLISNGDKEYDIITYKQEGITFFETTCTVYNPSVFELIEKQVAAGLYSLQALMRSANVKAVTPLQAHELKNFNNPEDL